MLVQLHSIVLKMSVGAAMVIPVVMLIRQAMKTMPKAWAYLLWVLVLVRLLCPVLPEMHVFSYPPMNSLERISNRIISLEAQEEIEGAPAKTTHADSDTVIHADQTQPFANKSAPQLAHFLPAMLWLTGVGAVLIWGGVSLGKLNRKLRSAIPVGNGVYAADHIETSFVTGLIRPRIYLPSDLPEEWVEPILLHERQHILRMDHWVKLLYYLALAVHWFNPLVWMAYRMMAVDMEMSCDEIVTRWMTVERRKDYAHALLRMATGRHGLVLAFGEGDTGMRIRNIFSPKRTGWRKTLYAVLLCLVAAVLILSQPVAAPSGRLEYPGFFWGDSPEEVKSTLTEMGSNLRILDESRWEADEKHSIGGYAFRIGEVEMFGQRASSAVFRFAEYSWNGKQLMLEEIVLYYPDGYEGEAADMEVLEAEITDMFGQPVKEVVSLYPGVTEVREERSPVNPHYTVWNSELTALDILTEEEIQAIYNRMTRLYTENNSLDRLPAPEVYRATLKTEVARITLRDTYFSLMGMDKELSAEARAKGATDYVLTLSGQAYLGFLDAAQKAKEP